MNRITCFILILILWVFQLNAALKFTIGSIAYEVVSSEEVSCKAANKKIIEVVSVPASVVFQGREYCVTRVADRGFADSPNLTEITLPNSVTWIGEGAFHNCPKLLKALMPDNAYARITQGEYGFGKYGIFKNCPSLTDVHGHTVLYPAYLVYDAIYRCDDVPFTRTVEMLGAEKMIAMKSPEVYTTSTESPSDIPSGDKQGYTPSILSKPANNSKNYGVAVRVDMDIPLGVPDNYNMFAIVIGNENYRYLENVEYAHNDAAVFAQYCSRTLGIPSSNILEYHDATLGDLYVAISELHNFSVAHHGRIKVLFYYAGHGAPEDASREAYLIPCDAPGLVTQACYPLKRLYDELSSVKSESVVAFMDACFSGTVRGDAMLTKARGVKLKPKSEQLGGNVVIFSATTGDQTAYPYREKRHGLFSYVLLEKIQSSVGNVSLGELADYLTEKVSEKSVSVNRKPQTPTVQFSPDMQDVWRSLTLR